MKNKLVISVIIATKNEERNIKEDINNPRIIETIHAVPIYLPIFSLFWTKKTFMPVSVSISITDKTSAAIP